MLLIVFTTSGLVFIGVAQGSEFRCVLGRSFPLFLILSQIFLKKLACPTDFF